MARYIDTDVLKDMLSNYYRQTQSLHYCVPQNELVFGMRVELNGILGDIEVIIDNVPEADVVEVKRGCWARQEKMVDGKARAEAVCSNCGTDVVYQVIDNRWQFENYCPNCGARMDGGEKDEDLC